ncbi:MAG: CdaR family protein [Gemmatimonadaceae bacterium]
MTASIAWQRRIKAALTEHLPLKLVALFFAFVVWLVVSGERPTEMVVPVRVEIGVDTAVTLRGPTPEVRALVVGRGRDLMKLWDTPPTISQRLGSDVPDSLSIMLEVNNVELPPGVAGIVRDVQPRSLRLRFDVHTRRLVPVRSALRIRADSGVRVAGAVQIEPTRVEVSGERRAVRRIDTLETVASELVVRDTMPITVAIDTAGLGVRVSPATVRVRVPVEPVEAAPPVADRGTRRQ